jgi:NAD(P)H-dependent flavin oxidoreductase YrpB (nitropropane dioxygenase family)
MGGVAGPRLVAAVAGAGGLGMLPIWTAPAERVGPSLDETRALTDAPFAVNLRADLAMHDHIAAAVDHGVTIIHTFWGDPSESARTVRRLGARLMVTVSDADTTKAALDAGAVALVAQGVEAGGHVFGTTPLAELLPLVADLAGATPVAAAGGLVTAEDAIAAFRLGASAAAFGTRFAATEQSDAHPDYKAALVAAGEGATAHTLCFDGGWPDAPHRVLANSTLRAWDAAGRPPPGERPGEGEVIMSAAEGRTIQRYAVTMPIRGMTGDTEAAALYAGDGVGRVDRVVSAATFVSETAEALRAWLRG